MRFATGLNLAPLLDFPCADCFTGRTNPRGNVVRKFLISAAMAAATAYAPAALAADVMTHFTVDRMTAMLKAAGATEIETKKPEPAVEIITFNDGKGTVNMILLDCAAQGCSSMQLGVFFEKDDRYSLSALNSYNAVYLNAQAALLKSGNVTLVRLVVADGGITEDNVKANLQIFLDAPALFEKTIQGQVTTSLDKKDAMPVAGAQPAKFDAMNWLDANSKAPKRRVP